MTSEAERLRRSRYKRGAKGKAANARYRRSAKGKAAAKRYWLSEKGKAVVKRYQRSSAGKAANASALGASKGRLMPRGPDVRSTGPDGPIGDPDVQRLVLEAMEPGKKQPHDEKGRFTRSDNVTTAGATPRSTP